MTSSEYDAGGLDQSQAIAQRLYCDPSIPHIPLDLHSACAVGDYQMVHKAVLGREDLNRRNRGGWTPLMYAAYVGRDTIVNLLLDGGANTNCSSNVMLTPLMVAAGSGIESVCYFLLQHGANIDDKDEQCSTALLHAVKQGQQRTVELLLDHGADCELSDQGGVTPLIQAAMDGHELIVEQLVAYGATIHSKTVDGMTAQAMAMRNRHMVIVSLLDNARFRQNFGGNSFNESDSSDEEGDLQSGPEAVARMMMESGAGATSDYQKYMEGKKNRHSFSSGFTGAPRRRLVKSSFSAPEQDSPPFYEQKMDKLDEEEHDPEKTLEAPSTLLQKQKSSMEPQLPPMPPLEDFLNYFGLNKLLPIFEEQEVDMATLLSFDDEDLKRAGVKLFGPRRRLVQAIEQLTGKASSSDVATPAAAPKEDPVTTSDQQPDLETMLYHERNIRNTTEQFALQLQLSRKQANECASALQQAVGDQVIHLTSTRNIFNKLHTSLLELQSVSGDLKNVSGVATETVARLSDECSMALKLHTVLGREVAVVGKSTETMKHQVDELCYHLLSSSRQQNT